MTTAIVLAGGLGTRLREAVADLPKPMAPIEGKPFLEYLLDYWIKQGVDHFILSVGYKYSIIQEHFGNTYKNARIDYSIENHPLGTGGAILLAVEKVPPGIPYLVLNGDTYFEVELTILENHAKASNADICFSLFRTSDSKRYMGVAIDNLGHIMKLKSDIDDSGGLANGGVYWMKANVLESFPQKEGAKISLEDDIFSQCLSMGKKFFGIEFRGNFVDIGIPGDYYNAPNLIVKM